MPLRRDVRLLRCCTNDEELMAPNSFAPMLSLSDYCRCLIETAHSLLDSRIDGYDLVKLTGVAIFDMHEIH